MPVFVKLAQDKKVLVAIFTIVSTALLGSFAPSSAQLFEGHFIQESRQESILLEASLGNALAAGRIAERELADPSLIQAFYQQRENRPYWLENDEALDKARVFAQALEKAWLHGLNPQHYHAKAIAALLKDEDESRYGPLEILLSDAFIRYTRDLSGMRVNAHALGLDPQHWRQPVTGEQALALLFGDTDIHTLLRTIEPQSPTYKALQAELAKLNRMPEEPYAAVMPLDFGRGLLRPAARHDRIPDLRLRLQEVQHSEDPRLYDDRLAAAVMRFQRDHGLKDDGIIGPKTLEALNRTREDRMIQIIANLERLRWVDSHRPDKYVVVNIPSATLWAIEDGQVAFEMPVIVGKPKRPTHSFITEIKGVRFNPDWTVPPTIKRDDIWPQLVENPSYLTDKGIELYLGYDHDAPTLDPESVEWAQLTPNDLHSLRMVQVPGHHNPLGRIRVLMPNRHNIYLHDTNQKSLFDKDERAQSSGCIRMKDPEKMAAFIMADKGWDDERIHAVLSTGRTQDYHISRPVPVYLLYYTAWADSQGRMVFGSDIYGQDKKLIELLTKVDGFYNPGDNKRVMANSGRSELTSVH